MEVILYYVRALQEACLAEPLFAYRVGMGLARVIVAGVGLAFVVEVGIALRGR